MIQRLSSSVLVSKPYSPQAMESHHPRVGRTGFLDEEVWSHDRRLDWHVQ